MLMSRKMNYIVRLVPLLSKSLLSFILTESSLTWTLYTSLLFQFFELEIRFPILFILPYKYTVFLSRCSSIKSHSTH